MNRKIDLNEKIMNEKLMIVLLCLIQFRSVLERLFTNRQGSQVATLAMKIRNRVSIFHWVFRMSNWEQRLLYRIASVQDVSAQIRQPSRRLTNQKKNVSFGTEHINRRHIELFTNAWSSSSRPVYTIKLIVFYVDY